MLTGFVTTNGALYLDLDEIAFIGPPVTKGGHDESRQIGLRGGGYVFIYNTPDAYAKLKALLPADAPALVAAAPEAKPKRTRKPKTE